MHHFTAINIASAVAFIEKNKLKENSRPVIKLYNALLSLRCDVRVFHLY